MFESVTELLKSFMKNCKQRFFSRIVSVFILLAFLIGQTLTPPIGLAANEMGVLLGNSPTVAFAPPVLLGLKVHPENPLLFDFIVDRGQTKLSDEEFKAETQKLVEYFFAALTIPDKEVWVNLSPYEKDRIIPDVLGKTQMGKTMLEQDYVLKQLAASLTNPDTQLGKKYWDAVNKAKMLDVGRWTLEKATSVQPLTSSDLNKVWIVPAKAKVLESNGIVVVDEKRLKVMMAEDRSLDGQRSVEIDAGAPSTAEKTLDAGRSTLGEKSITNVQRPTSNVSSDIFRTTILPSIEKEINEGKDFAAVRQVYNSVILAAWYKQALKESLLGKVYTDKAKVAGIETDDKEMKQRIYDQYLAAFKKGAYNFIKEEEDADGDLIPRKYFSGGIATEFGQVAGSALEVQAVSSVAVEQPILRASASVVRVVGEEPAAVDSVAKNLSAQSATIEQDERIEHNLMKYTISSDAFRVSANGFINSDVNNSQKIARTVTEILQNFIKRSGWASNVFVDVFVDSTLANFDLVSIEYRKHERSIHITVGRSMVSRKHDINKMSSVERDQFFEDFGNGKLDADLDPEIVLFDLAHEIAHFANGDLDNSAHVNESRMPMEIEHKADLLAAEWLFNMGYSLDDILVILLKSLPKVIAVGQEMTHPSNAARAEYVQNNFRSKDKMPVAAGSALTSAQIDEAAKRIIGALTKMDEFADKIARLTGQNQSSLEKFVALLLTKALPPLNISNPTVDQLNAWTNEAGIKRFSTAQGVLSLDAMMNQYLGYRFENGGVSVVPEVILQEIRQLTASTPAAANLTEEPKKVGGINFDPTLLNLQIKRDGRGVPLPLPEQNIENIKIDGLVPIIINIQPVNAQTLPVFLGKESVNAFSAV